MGGRGGGRVEVVSSSPPLLVGRGGGRVETLGGGGAVSSFLSSFGDLRFDLRFLPVAMFIPSVFDGCVGLMFAFVGLLSLAEARFRSEV